MYTQSDLLKTAMQHSAWDIGAEPELFRQTESVAVTYQKHPAAKRNKEPSAITLISYGNNTVAAAMPEYLDIAAEFVRKFEWYRCFEPPAIQWLNRQMEPYGKQTCFLSSYYLPELSRLKPLPCSLELRLLEPPELAELNRGIWGNALSEHHPEWDVLGVGAYDRGKMVGLAACSSDCENMWQIGVDVLPEARRHGVAAAVTSHVAVEILNRGKIPFYGIAWANLASARNALKCGFVPTWNELAVTDRMLVESFIE